MNRASTPAWNLLPLAAGVFLIWILAAIFTSLCLYADGAHEFVRVLETQNFVSLMWSRHFAFYIFQFPLVLAIKLGVTNLALLRFCFGLGCFLPWPLVLLLCRQISPENFWLAAVGCAAGYLNANTPAISEHILAHAIFWPALFVLLFARPLKIFSALILLVMAMGLQFSYESQIFLCAPLLVLSLWRSFQASGEKSSWPWMVFFVAAILFLSSMVNGIYSVLMPELPGNFSGFKSGTLGILKHLGWSLTWTLLWVGLAVTACLSEKIWRILSEKNGRYLWVTVILVWGFWPLLAPETVDTGVPYDNRVVNLIVPLTLLPLAWMLRFSPTWLATRRPRLVLLTAALLLAQSLGQLSSTVVWGREASWMQKILEANRGIIPLRATTLAADGMLGREMHPDAIGGRFDWSWPCLSLALTPGKQINSLICSEVFLDPTIRRHNWQPFDPFNPLKLPNLNHYGLDYSNYLSAIHELNFK